MKALCWYGNHDVRVETVPDPKIMNPRDAIVRVTHTGLSRGPAEERHGRGWDHYLPRLAAVAAGDDPGQDPWIERPDGRVGAGQEGADRW